MRSGDVIFPPRANGWTVALLVIASGLGIALVVTASPRLAIGALGGVVFLILFLERPDVGLLVALFVRSSTDLTVIPSQTVITAQNVADAAGRIESSPLNIGLLLILTFGGGVFLLGKSVSFLGLPGATPLALLLFTGLLSLGRAAFIAHSLSLLAGMSAWVRVLSSLIIYAVAAKVLNSKQRIQRAIDVLAASCVIPMAFGFYQFGRGFIPTGTFVNQNTLGVFLVLIIIVFLSQLFVHSGGRKILALSIVATSFLLLFLTGSRSSWIGAFVAVLIIGALKRRIFLVLAPLVAIIAVATLPSVSSRLADPLHGSFEDRLDIWQSTAPVWMGDTSDAGGVVPTVVNRLMGTGPGSVGFLVLRGHGWVNAEHNDYLAVLYEYGVLGLAAYLSMCIAILRSGYRTWRRCTDEKMAAIALSFVALTPAFMTMSLTSNIFGVPANEVYYWVLAGLTVSISRLCSSPATSLSVSSSASTATMPTDRPPVFGSRAARSAERSSI
jgi:O-antigen ligase